MTTDSGSSLPQLPRFLSTTAHHKHHDVFDETHKPLFPLSYDSDVPGLVLAILGLLVAAGGGIGGGGILVPIYILVLNFSPKHAIPLSNVTVLGGSIANNLLNARKRHPEADRPLIDWDLVLVMEPLTIAGALIGAILNKVLPEQLLATLLVLLLSATGYTTLSKAKKLYKKETLQMLRSPNNGELESELTRIHRDIEDNMVVPPTNVKRGIYSEEEKESDNNKNKNNNASADSSSADSASQSPESDSPDSDDDMYYAGNEKTSLLSPNEKAENKILEDKRLVAILEEEKEVQMSKIIILVVMFSLVLIINILKGGGGFASPLGIKCGSKSFWIANIIILAWIIAVSNHCRELLLKKFRNKKECRYRYIEGDIVWDESATVRYPIVCCMAGFFAGMFGVGGGIVKGPLMLAMGVHPKVASACSACMIFFTSFTATTSFVVFGLLVTDYAVICMIIGFVSTYVGQIGLNVLMKKNSRNSYIAFSIGGVVLLSAFLMGVEAVLSIAESKNHHVGGLCGVSD
ncbi:hypothetical protein ScalyP_jg8235 [Parmales sp. scaly parma]|nr:hypothetical protein ScalyP_jg8235 [Parmales sp. scaly parma]